MFRRLKPRVLKDVYHPERTNVFRLPESRINLRHIREWRIPLSLILRTMVVGWASWALILGAVAAPTVQTHAATSLEERARLEAELAELERQIDQYENQVAGYQKQGKTLKGEISTLNSKIAKLNLQIRAIDLTLGELDKKIVDTQGRIQLTEAQIENNKKILGVLLKNLHTTDNTSLMEVFLANPKISDFFGDLNNLSLLQTDVRKTIAEIQDLQTDLKNQKEQFAIARADASTMRTYQTVQKSEADSVKKEKNTLLAVTQGQEAKYQAIVKEKQATAAEIRKRIFSLLGGGQMSFGQAYEYAKFAANATGVRAAMILAVLDRESALGKNVGGCTYHNAMSPTNQKVFFEILKELGMSPDSVKVSCPNADGVYGGAMGPAQFIPTTWVMYKDRIAAVTGHNPPSPWTNIDAFVATGLYLRDAGAAGGTLAAERQAAARYYAGGNWQRFLWTYGQAVISRAEKFEADIRTLTNS